MKHVILSVFIGSIFFVESIFAYTSAPAGAISVSQYGAVPDGRDCGKAIDDAFTAVKSGGSIFFEAGKTYSIKTGVRVSGGNGFKIYG